MTHPTPTPGAGEFPQLLPCPFCGEDAFHVHVYAGEEIVRCSNTACPAAPMVGGATEAEAVAAWNQRTPAVALRAQGGQAGESGEALPETVANAVVQMVGEMDDRTSPEDWPEAMLVTGPELHAVILLAFERNAEAAALRAQAAPTAAAEEPTDAQLTDVIQIVRNIFGGQSGSSDRARWDYMNARARESIRAALQSVKPKDAQ